MRCVFDWMTANWYIVSAVALLLIAVSNSLTKHWSGNTKLARVLTWISEMLSPFTSKNVPGWWKWPFESVSPGDAAREQAVKDAARHGPMLFALLVGGGLLGAALLSGCATWQQTAKVSLDSAGEVAVGARQVGEPRWIAACDADARACAAATDPTCPALVACQAKHHAWNTALKAVHTARFVGYSAILAADQVAAENALAAIRPAITTITDALVAWKVLP